MTRRNSQALLLVIVMILGIASAATYYFGFVVMKVSEFPMDAKVSDRIGFNAGTDALHFGTVYPGGESRRQIRVTNRNPFAVLVTVRNSGNISGWVVVDTPQYLSAYENRTLDYTLIVPADAGLGNYSGGSRIVVKRKIL
jgi:hypothetical protein